MLRQQAFRYRLRPTGDQRRQMGRIAGACRYVYNRALAEQEARHAAGERRLPYARLCNAITAWRHDPETAWLAEMPVHPLQQSARDLRRAYANRFEGRADRPRFKKRGRSRASFRYPDPGDIRLDEARDRIFLPKLGWIRYRNSRPILGDVCTVTVSEDAGHWYISVQTEREVETPIHPSTSAVGIDLGIARFATCSDGTVLASPHSFRRHERRLARAQRALARKVPGSHNREKARRHVARLHARIAAVRADFLHQASHMISKTHAIVVVEDLTVRAMSASARGTVDRPGRRVRQKAGLNKAILDQGWAEFRRQLAYKCAWRGGALRVVPAANTSRRCPTSDGGCGHVAAENRPTQAAFACVACGYTNHADLVGALNVLEADGRAASACGGSALGSDPAKQEPTEGCQAAPRPETP